jgi:hypothetical protein
MRNSPFRHHARLSNRDPVAQVAMGKMRKNGPNTFHVGNQSHTPLWEYLEVGVCLRMGGRSLWRFQLVHRRSVNMIRKSARSDPPPPIMRLTQQYGLESRACTTGNVHVDYRLSAMGEFEKLYRARQHVNQPRPTCPAQGFKSRMWIGLQPKSGARRPVRIATISAGLCLHREACFNNVPSPLRIRVFDEIRRDVRPHRQSESCGG